MTPRERTALNAGIEAVRQMALVSAVTLEVRDDAGRVQHQAAVAALQALAEGARDLMLQATAVDDRCISVVVYNGPEAPTGHEAAP